jgi:hypothetical protein
MAECCSRFWIQLIILSVSIGILLCFLFFILDEEIQEYKADGKKSIDIEILIFLRYLVGFSAFLVLLTVLVKIYARYFLRNTIVGSENTILGNMMRTELRRLPLGRISNFHMSLMMRDFTSADYELLQHLDDNLENKQKRKAAEFEIARLPHFKITARDVTCNTGENKGCTICLEPFEVNQIVKILPCLHRYHIKCVDTWLRENAICPICKYPVSDVV